MQGTNSKLWSKTLSLLLPFKWSGCGHDSAIYTHINRFGQSLLLSIFAFTLYNSTTLSSVVGNYAGDRFHGFSRDGSNCSYASLLPVKNFAARGFVRMGNATRVEPCAVTRTMEGGNSKLWGKTPSLLLLHLIVGLGHGRGTSCMYRLLSISDSHCVRLIFSSTLHDSTILPASNT